MSKLTTLITLAAVLALAAAGIALDKKPDDKKAEKVDNPEFKSWSKYKAGTSKVEKQSIESNGMKVAVTSTTKLVEVSDDKCVIETESVSTLDGKEIKSPPMKRDVPKQVDKAQVGAEYLKTGKPEGTTEEGKEKVKVGGTEYECKWYKTKAKLPSDDEVTTQMWLNEDVPGLYVKMVSKSKGFASTTEATEITIKK